MNLLERLERNIAHQTRNGRTEIYVSTDDLEQLGMTPFERKGMVYINLDKLNMLMQKYQNTPDKIMQRRNEEDWER